MKFNLVSKNNMGIVITLILVVFLSQSRFFDFLTETALGRMVLLGMVIFISYTNKILGLLAVLFIIIGFNQYNMNVVQSYTYYEGFQDGSGNHLDGSGNKIVTAKENVVNKKLTAANNAAQKISANRAAATSTSTTTTTSSESFRGREGFCMTDREINILRGKQSNTIPVFNNTRNQDDNISPSDKSVFSGSYASF